LSRNRRKPERSRLSAAPVICFLSYFNCAENAIPYFIKMQVFLIEDASGAKNSVAFIQKPRPY